MRPIRQSVRAKIRGLTYRLEEVRELGFHGSVFRLSWEARRRSGYFHVAEKVAHAVNPLARDAERPWLAEPLPALALGDPGEVAAYVSDHLSSSTRKSVSERARQAAVGDIVCFGRHRRSYGDPIEWHRHPGQGRLWPSTLHWSQALASGPLRLGGSTSGDISRSTSGDIKWVWEVGRFPHAYDIARARCLVPNADPWPAEALKAQINAFIAENPPGYGVHWASGQEIAFRLIAWVFAYHTLPSWRRDPLFMERFREALIAGARHIDRYLDYARFAVHNNHILSEALGLITVGALLRAYPESARWIQVGTALLVEHTEKQFYPDGGYIQQSHNYHRLALQDLLWASRMLESSERPRPRQLTQAFERSLGFLTAQQNPLDGRLPNYGFNDGALPSILTTCDFSDFRPILQAVSVLVAGERLYEQGPWDEEAAWFLGPAAVDQAPLRPYRAKTSSFPTSGHYIMHGKENGTYATFRCGSVRDRFSQIDMLHLDIWWRGFNIAVDGGSYLYNGSDRWNRHFMGGPSHNTLTIDDHDQMVHYRRFKVLYPTRARCIESGERADSPDYLLRVGEHDGFQREIPGCIHRRAVLFDRRNLWVVVDHVTILDDGKTRGGLHHLRLHWLLGDFPYDRYMNEAGVVLRTPAGPFGVAVFDESAAQLSASVVRGQDDPPRGWLSRYYGEKIGVPSLVVTRDDRLPLTFVSVLGAADLRVSEDEGRMRVSASGSHLEFELADGIPTHITVAS